MTSLSRVDDEAITARARPASGGSRSHADVSVLLGAILANSAEAIVVVDELGDILLATQGAAELLGHDPEAMVATSAFTYLHPDDVDDAADLFVQRLGYQGRDPGKEVRVRHSSGDWVEVTATVSLLPAFGTAAITMRPGLDGSRERALQRRIAVAEFCNRLGTELMGTVDSGAVLARMRDSLREVGLLTGAEIALVYLERQERDALELLGSWRSPGAGADTPVEIVHDPRTVERLLTEHLIADDLDRERHRDLAVLTAPLKATGLLATPFTTGSKRGTVVLLRTRRGTSWWESDGDLARSIANLYGRALHTAWSDELLATTYRHGPVAFSIRTWDGELVDCNQRYLDLLGCSRHDAQGVPLLDITTPPTAEQRAQWQALQAGTAERVVRELEIVRPDSSRIWVRSDSVPLQVPGLPERYVLTAFDDITESRRQRLELEHAATHDPLTGVANRTAFYQHIERVRRDRGVLPTLFMVDLDRFKLVNDGHGHALGDAVLTTTARRLRQQVRSDDLVARLGGDEFAIMVPGVDAVGATDLAHRLRRALERPILVDGRYVSQTVSIGIAIGAHAGDLPDLLVRADRALYSAKHQGRNQHVLFDDTMHDEVLDRLTIERDLRRAIDAGELDVHFQPEFTVDEHRIVGAEALVRWHHPERGVVPAAEFVPIAEHSGLIDEVGRFALRQATMLFAGLCRRTGKDDLTLRVNISAGEFARPELPEVVAEALEISGLPPDRLCVEITETTLMAAADVALVTLGTLRRLGVKVAIDDFGTGYSSLAYLKRFVVDAIKVDGSFVRDVVDDPASRAIVKAVIGLCLALDLEAVAEGVETTEQLDVLASIGCRLAQGHLVSGALPIEQFEALLG